MSLSLTERSTPMSVSISDVALCVIAVVVFWAKLKGWG